MFKKAARIRKGNIAIKNAYDEACTTVMPEIQHINQKNIGNYLHVNHVVVPSQYLSARESFYLDKKVLVKYVKGILPGESVLGILSVTTVYVITYF